MKVLSYWCGAATNLLQKFALAGLGHSQSPPTIVTSGLAYQSTIFSHALYVTELMKQKLA